MLAHRAPICFVLASGLMLGGCPPFDDGTLSTLVTDAEAAVAKVDGLEARLALLEARAPEGTDVFATQVWVQANTAPAGDYLTADDLPDQIVGEAEAELLSSLVAYLSVDDVEPALVISGANLRVVSGSGSTDDGGVAIGVANVIVGYDGGGTAGGSHNVVVGDAQEWTGTGTVHTPRLAEVEASVAGLDSRVVAAESGLVAVTADLIAVEAAVVGVEAGLAAADEGLIDHEARLVSLESVDVEARLVAVEDELSAFSEVDLTPVTDRLDSLEADDVLDEVRLMSLEADAIVSDDRLTALEAEDLAIGVRLEAAEAAGVLSEGRLDLLEAADADVVIRLDLMEAGALVFVERLDTLDDGAADAEGRLDIVETAIDDHALRLSTLEVDTVTAATLAATLSDYALTSALPDLGLLEALEPYVSVDPAADAIMFAGANVYVQSGSGSTDDGGFPTGLGNLVVGYDEGAPISKTGAHNLIVGAGHTYLSTGGLLTGQSNVLDAVGGAVIGGAGNTVTGLRGVVVGGSGLSEPDADAVTAAIDGLDFLADLSAVVSVGGGEVFFDGVDVTLDTGTLSAPVLDDFASITSLVDVEELGALTAYLEVDPGSDAVRITGANLFVQSGSGSTDDGGSLTGLGNVVVGYDAGGVGGSKIGSHNLVLGDSHSYTSYGGMVAGQDNEIGGPGATVVGGTGNVAQGDQSVVVGGDSNLADAGASVAVGGQLNFAMGLASVTVGGGSNLATGTGSVAVAGVSNDASGTNSAVLAGALGEASGTGAAIVSGDNGLASGLYGAILGGEDNTASGAGATVLGGKNGTANGANQIRP